MSGFSLYSFIQLLTGYCAVFLFSFLSPGQNSVAQPNNPEQESNVDKTEYFLVSDGYNQPFHNPFSIPSLPESDRSSSDEEETKDYNEDEFSKWGHTSVNTEYLRCTYTKSSVFSFISSVQNRQAVSLYILHHCWKSFLFDLLNS